MGGNLIKNLQSGSGYQRIIWHVTSIDEHVITLFTPSITACRSGASGDELSTANNSARHGPRVERRKRFLRKYLPSWEIHYLLDI